MTSLVIYAQPGMAMKSMPFSLTCVVADKLNVLESGGFAKVKAEIAMIQ